MKFRIIPAVLISSLLISALLLAPAALADTNLEMSVTYYAGYRDGKKLWEIDPFNYICEIGGVDYMADVRKALGK